jgi:hypothetical protein
MSAVCLTLYQTDEPELTTHLPLSENVSISGSMDIYWK